MCIAVRVWYKRALIRERLGPSNPLEFSTLLKRQFATNSQRDLIPVGRIVRLSLPTVVMCTMKGICCALMSLTVSVSFADEQQLVFDHDVLPILQTYCAKCHGPESLKGELDLSRPQSILKGGESGEPGIVIGKAAESPLYRLLANDEMPPKDLPRPTRQQVEMIKSWIDAGAVGLSLPSAPVEAENELARNVFDVMEWKCLTCHGRREKRGDLDLRTIDSMLKGGKSGPAIVVGDPKASLLVKRIHADEMPPFKQRYPYAVKPVAPQELDQIRQWIAAGAPEPRYDVLGDEGQSHSESDRQWWAFQPPRSVPLPDVRAVDRAVTSMDRFVVARLEQVGLTLSPEADRRVLIRRVCDDLWGLPPRPEEVEDFVADGAEGAYERLVDRLLASPRYGERWAQHWLDAAGFAESEGLESADPVFPEMYRYRDYVVRSLNSDKPFDRFITEQLAGDELAAYRDAPALTPELADNIIATGFLRTAMDSTREPAVNFYVNRLQVLDDTVEIVSSNLLGLSIRCAKCHSHKYDPISQRDYYRFAAIFAAAYSPQDWLKPAERLRPLMTEAEQTESEKHNAAVNEKLNEAKKPLDELNDKYLAQLRDLKTASLPADVQDAVREALNKPAEEQSDEMRNLLAKHGEQVKATLEDVPKSFPDYAEAVKPLQAAVDEIKSQLLEFPQAHALTDVTTEAAPFYLLNRGEWDRRGGQVLPGIPAVLNRKSNDYHPEPSPANTTGRRLAFARWLTQPDHPLTSRVFVNRVWRQYFGHGIVPTVGDFGRAGSMPSHPELLDHIAIQFVESGWSMKQLHRSIALSATYRQASHMRDEAQAIDPENRLLWRMPMRRRDAESIRDGILAIAGTLNEQMYGPSSTTETQPDGQVITPATAQNRRRSVYMLHRRLTPETILETFDAPRMSTNCLERRSSTVVNQSLLLLHSQFLEEQSAELARRMRMTAGEDANAQIISLYQLVLSRNPNDDEHKRAVDFLETATSGELPDLLAELSLVLLNSAEFLYVD